MSSQAVIKKLTPQEEALALAIDGSLVAQDLIQSFNEFCSQLDASTKETTNGTSNKLKHLQAKIDYKLKIIAALQSLGLLPRDLGNMTRTEFIFKATVAKGGGVTTAPVTAAQAAELERKEFSALPTQSPTPQAFIGRSGGRSGTADRGRRQIGQIGDRRDVPQLPNSSRVSSSRGVRDLGVCDFP
jgi:hypothetical protein